MSLEVHILPALTTNFIYVLRDSDSGEVAVVDPSEAAPVEKLLTARGWSLQQIWNTHHHQDHIGGNTALVARYGSHVSCSAYDHARVPESRTGLREGDMVTLGNHKFQILEIPGHTLGSIAYFNPQEKTLFAGDTLFTSGCGRLLEGSAEQLWQSLQKLAALPAPTQIFSGHEYGLQNAAFAVALEPENPDFRARFEAIQGLIAAGGCSSPSRMSDEYRCNPFLRARDLADFTRLRALKDDFRLEHPGSIR